MKRWLPLVKIGTHAVLAACFVLMGLGAKALFSKIGFLIAAVGFLVAAAGFAYDLWRHRAVS